MNSHPVRFFHAFLSGAVVALLVAVMILQIEQRAHATTDGSPPTSPAVPPLVPTAADLDGDGIPNTWETQFHHDPNNATDAGADFDNDGLTTLQEYQLSVQTNGASGNPLGKWKFETAEVPAEVEGEYFSAVDINERGDFLVQILPLDIPALRTFLITHDTPDPLWTEVLAPGNPGIGTNMATDLNESRQIVGCYYPPNGSAQGYKWGTTNGAVPFLFGGQPAQAYKMNDRGDWVGVLKHAATGEWRPAHVVNSSNLQLPNDWWTELSFTGINNYGEALGTYLNVASGSYRTFLAQGTWRYDTGLSGLMPTTDPTSSYWFWNAALNSYGEFTGAADVSDQQTTYAGYVFDGSFRRISLGGREIPYISPDSMNDSKTVVGFASDDVGTNINGAFISRDGVGLYLEELITGLGHCETGKINNRGQILTANFPGAPILISPDQDQDGDTMSDDWEDAHGLDRHDASDAYLVRSADGINNLGKFLLRADPNTPLVTDSTGNTIDIRPGIDTDGDHIPNVWEWQNGLDYQDASDAALDFDRDGYTNLQEFRLKTDPRGAPSYRIRELGPFPQTSSVKNLPGVLGNGTGTASGITENVMESLYFTALPLDGTGTRPAVWTQHRSESLGSFALYPQVGATSTSLVAQSPSGAALGSYGSSPTWFCYWASPNTPAEHLSGAVHDIRQLNNPRFSPSGNYLVATRYLQSSTTYQLVLWKMPAPGQTFLPIPLTAPAGATVTTSAKLQVNDAGVVTTTGKVGTHSRQVKARMPDSTGDFRVRLSRSTCLGSGSNVSNSARSRALISRTARRS